MANNLGSHGNPEAAVRHQQAAIVLLERLVAEFPKQVSYRIDLAFNLSDLSQILSRKGQHAEAFDSVQKANRIQRILITEHPEDPHLRYTLSLSTRGMGALLRMLDRWKESKQHFAESVEIMERIVAENPAVNEYRRVLATSSAEYGECLIDHDEIEVGLNALAKAREHAEKVAKTNPNDVRNLNALAMILRGIGKTRAKQGKPVEAIETLREAIAIGDRIAGENHMFAYDLACGLALLTEVTGNLPTDPGNRPQDLSREYSDRAMTVLRQAVDHGYREVDWLERDPDLRSLRSRSDFQALLKTMRQTSKPSPSGP
jgi:tetratricopeptide (TPR) repeat protein